MLVISYRHHAGYVFEPLLRKALEDFKDLWNNHKIQRNKVARCPHGVPDDRYLLPQLNGSILVLNAFIK